MYYNNFEVSATKLWYSVDYKEYINMIDRIGGIYYNRWGDAPINPLPCPCLFLRIKCIASVMPTLKELGSLLSLKERSWHCF